MIKSIEEQKSKALRMIEKNMAEYFDEFERGSDQEGFNINKIEGLMKGVATKFRETLEEATSNLASSVYVDSKKNALIAEQVLRE